MPPATTPYGEVVDRTSSSLPSLWGYQGRLDLADPDLLDFGFRPYAPDLGAFTSPDDQAGSALNPLTFNRYLYAGANPETLVDPDGHCWGICIDFDPLGFANDVVSNVGDFGAGLVEGAWNGAVGLGSTVVGAAECIATQGCVTEAMRTATVAIGDAATAFARDPGGATRAALSGAATAVGGAIGGTIDRVTTAWATGDFHGLGEMTGEAGFTVATAIATGGALSAFRAGTSLTVGVAGALANAGRTVIGLGRSVVGLGRSALAAAEGLGGRLGSSVTGMSRIRWVSETAHMGKGAAAYQAAAPGARAGLAPALPYSRGGVQRLVRFDGVDRPLLRAEMIDRKTAIPMTPKTRIQAIRQDAALEANGLKGRWEVPTAYEAGRAARILSSVGASLIRVRVVR